VSGQSVVINGTLVHRDDPQGIIRAQIPGWFPAGLKLALQSRIGADRLARRAEARGLRNVRPGDICYFWPGSSPEAMKRARDIGAFVVIEFINTHVAYRKRIIDHAASERNQPALGYLANRVDAEEARLEASDLVFAPGPFVGESIIENTSNPPVILETSYGAHTPEIGERADRKTERLRFLFVGDVSLPKGVFDLMDAWRMAKLDAELLIAGRIRPNVLPIIEASKETGVVPLGYQSDISRVYDESDVFVFPSLDEGGPQVCYEAAAHGLPLIVTPMGGGRIADKENAIVVPRQNPQELASALRRLASDPDLRLRMGKAARQASLTYTWEKVAQRRLTQLLAAVERLEKERA
jgi:glycosyltransferase involved in cell wall biosynthesis